MQPVKERPVLLCPICDKECKTPAGLAAHTKRCENMPSVEQVRELAEQGYPKYLIAEKLQMKHSGLALFMAENGLDTDKRLMAERRQGWRELDVCQGLAPQFGKTCIICELKDHCQAFLLTNMDDVKPWWPCEAPEVDDVRVSKRRWPRW